MTRPVFDDAALARLRSALVPRQAPGAFEAGRWWVASASRAPEALRDAPASVTLRDITLRTVAHMAGVSMPRDDRHRLLRAIVASGVPEVMSTTTRPADEVRRDVELVRETAPGCKIVVDAVGAYADVSAAAEFGFDRAAVVGAGAPTTQEAIDRTVELVTAIRDAGLAAGATIELIAKQSDVYVAEFCAAVEQAGADEVLLADGSSSMSPEAFAHVVRVAKSAARSVRVGVHTHDFLGLGLACALNAVLAGAEVVEVSVNGYRFGRSQADLAVTAVALEAVYGLATGIDLRRLTPLSRLAESVVGLEIGASHPVVGRDIFALGWPDPFVEETFVEPLLHKPITPLLVGSRYRILPTVSAGPFGFWRLLDELGIEATKPEIEAIAAHCLAIIERENRRVTEDDVHEALSRSRARPA